MAHTESLWPRPAELPLVVESTPAGFCDHLATLDPWPGFRWTTWRRPRRHRGRLDGRGLPHDRRPRGRRRAGTRRHHRRVLPRPSGSVVYELTDYGRGLEDAVLSLARWGTKSIGERGPDDVIYPSAFALGLRSAFHPEAARGVTATYEVCFGNAVVHLRVADGAVEAREGPADEPDLKIATDAALPALLRGDLSPAEAERTGAVRLSGDARLLEPFTTMFRLD